VSLLRDIQTTVLQEGSDLGPILLKLRLLAARLGSQPLADWVKHESEGYPRDADLPDYRIIEVSYTATFSGPFGSGIQNAPISPYLIKRFAGKHWIRHEMRDSIATVDDLLATSATGGTLGINASDLILLLQDKVYPDYACNSVTGKISRSALAAIRHSVRSRVLELTIELEKSIPEASAVSLGAPDGSSNKHAAAATQIAQQIIYGNYTSVSATGDGARIAIAVGERDVQGLVQFLSHSGLAESDAKELAQLASTEEPESKSEPMGPKVRTWLVENLKKAANGTWKVGLSVASDVVKEALLKYYGLK
jgi:AbiTii